MKDEGEGMRDEIDGVKHSVEQFTRTFHPSSLRLSSLALSYSEILKDHLARPRHVGEMRDADARAEQINPVCGDRLCLFMRLNEGRIEAASFLAYGCAPTLACGSALAEMLKGMTIEEAARISREDLTRALGGLPKRKQHAAALAIETLRTAIDSSQATK
jgi:NifU-like protein involved in Fe-S cluster formation